MLRTKSQESDFGNFKKHDDGNGGETIRGIYLFIELYNVSCDSHLVTEKLLTVDEYSAW